MNQALFILGLVVIVLGVLAAGYTLYEDRVYFFGAYNETTATKPYSDWAVPLIGIGVVIVLISALSPTVKTTTKTSHLETPVRKTKIVHTEE